METIVAPTSTPRKSTQRGTYGAKIQHNSSARSTHESAPAYPSPISPTSSRVERRNTLLNASKRKFATAAAAIPTTTFITRPTRMPIPMMTLARATESKTQPPRSPNAIARGGTTNPARITTPTRNVQFRTRRHVARARFGVSQTRNAIKPMMPRTASKLAMCLSPLRLALLRRELFVPGTNALERVVQGSGDRRNCRRNTTETKKLRLQVVERRYELLRFFFLLSAFDVLLGRGSAVR